MTGTKIRNSVVSAVCAAVGLSLVAGCGSPVSGFLARHLDPDRKAVAKENWDAMRGRVKLRLAQQQLAAGQLHDADKTLQQARAMCPDDVDALVLEARIRLEQGRLAEAREAVAAAVTRAPAYAEAAYVEGMVAERYGDLEIALAAFGRAAYLSPHEAGYLRAQAETMVALDRLADAAELLEARIPDFDNNIPLRMLAARVYQLLGLRSSAVSYAREAHRLSEGKDARLSAEAAETMAWAEAWNDVIDVLEPLVDPPEAAANERPADDTSYTRISLNLARAYLESGRAGEAQRMLNTLVDDPRCPAAAWPLYARALLATGEYRAAARAVAKTMEKAPPTAEALMLAAYISMNLREFDGAKAAANRASELDPSLWAAPYLIGRAEEALGRTREAQEAFERVLQLDPPAPIAAALAQRLSLADPGSKNPPTEDPGVRSGPFSPD